MRQITYNNIIFDFDGTLLDTQPLEQYKYLFKQHPKFTKKHSDGRKEYLSHVKDCKQFDGLDEEFSYIKQQGLNAYIVTSGTKDKVDVFIKEFGHTDVFNPLNIVGCYARGRFKRLSKKDGDPTLFNILLEKYSIDPSTCIAFGNELFDKLAANNAKIKAYNCSWGATEEEARLMKEQYEASTIDNPREIIGLLGSAAK